MIVTVVTPTFNAIRYLDECIQSARRQESPHVAIEHIVVDGGSSDGTVELARSRGTIVLQGTDDGVFDAARKGIAKSSGELVGFLGADDLLLPGALDVVVRHYERDRLPWLVGGFRWIDGEGRSLGDIATPPRWMSQRMMAALGWCCINHMATYVTRQFYEDLGGFDTSFRFAGDYDFFCRALGRAPRSRMPQTIACFRRHGANLTMSNTSRQLDEDRLVAERYASPSRLVRALDRQTLRLYLNARNPTWAIRKQVGALRSQHQNAPADSSSH